MSRASPFHLAARVTALEPWIAPICAAILLLAPNPLVWPAAFVGLLPVAARFMLSGRPWRATPFDLPLLLLAIGSLLGGWASLSADGAFVRLTGLLAALLLFAAARDHPANDRALTRLVSGLLVAAVVASLSLLVLVGPFLLLDHLPPVAALVRAVDRWGLGGWFVDQDWLLQRYRFRASGVGALAVMGLALVFAKAVPRSEWRARVLSLAAVPVFLSLLVVADNRGAMLAAALTIGAMATVWRRRLLPLVPIGAVLALLVMALGPTDRGLSLKTLAQRFWFWENSLYLARELPFTGVGLGLESVQLVYRAYFLPAYPPFSHAHSIYLQGLLEFGVIGLLGLVGLGAATLYLGWTAPKADSSATMAGRLAGFGLAVALLTAGLSEIVMLTTFGTAIGLGALGLLAATSGRSSPQVVSAISRDASRLAPGHRWRIVAVTLAGVAILASVVMTPLGAMIAARGLLNVGTAELNRGLLSESIDKAARETSIASAVSYLQSAADLDPIDAVTQRNLALALAASGDGRLGRSAADRAKALTAVDDLPGQFQLGRTFTAVTQWGDAIRAYETARASDQLLQLGNRLLRLRNHDQAAAAFMATARVDPDSRGAYDGLTRAVRERKGSTDDVLAALRPLMVAGSSTEYDAHLQAARVSREAGRLYDARQLLAKAEDVRGGPDLSFEVGRVMLAAGRPDQAVTLFSHGTADEPYDPEHWLWLARAQAQLGKHEQAAASIREGLSKADPSGLFAPPAERLPETAAVRAIEIRRSERAPLLGTMAESLIRLGRAAEAMPALDEAVAAAPRDGWLASVRDEARAIHNGAPVNLALNPSFTRDGAWSLGHAAWWLRPTAPTLLNETVTIEDGTARLTWPPTGDRALVQEVMGLQPDTRYRLTVRLRADDMSRGALHIQLGSRETQHATVATLFGPEAVNGATVDLDARTGSGQDTALVIAIGFDPQGTPAGASVVVEDVMLTPAIGESTVNTRTRTVP